MNLIDNINTRLGDELKKDMDRGNKLSVAASTFSIYAFEALKKELKELDELRFIFTSPVFVSDSLKPEMREYYVNHSEGFTPSEALTGRIEQHLCGGEFELRLKNELNQRAIARECSEWIRRKVTFKSNTQPDKPISGMIHVGKQGTNDLVYSPVAGFTTTDLGTTPSNRFTSFVHKFDYPVSGQYLDLFNQIWNDKEQIQDVTHQVLAFLEKSYKENSPEFIYFVTLYNIFNDFLKDISTDTMPNDSVGFKDTVIWNKLYNFQQDAVIGAINKLEKYNGCIVADSVGLGKTFTALGIIKYYEKRNKDVLVLCPKKLADNWNVYCNNDKNNPLHADRFRYDVLFHTDLSRERGISNGRNLENVNWGNYGLIVIDESHNFRNNNTIVGRENRYQKLLRKVIQEGIETKVLMLSATPVNNRFNDLKNQLALAYEGYAKNIDDKLDTERGVDEIFKRAQTAFNIWSKFPSDNRTTESLLERLDFDFFELLDSLTIARSRKHITTYYDTTAIGKFPVRNKPVSIQSPLTENNSLNYHSIAEQLMLLNLSIYTPINYVLPSKQKLYAEKYDKQVKASTFTQAEREKSLQILMRINLLKRIESSLDSFRITLQGVLDQVTNFISMIDRQVDGVIDVGFDSEDDIADFDMDSDWGDEENVIGKKIKIRLSDVDKTRWKEDLMADKEALDNLLSQTDFISTKGDNKLNLLKELISKKIESPINDGNKKVIIFTAFADTANYLYASLSKWFAEKYQLHAALITGSKCKSTSTYIHADLNTLLTCFSPISKGKALAFPNLKDEIDLLIGTDCISEGQNLQDCDYLINYDIHWNPVRIIQRFGRIDRIGSKNETITLVNFWPDVSLDSYINLKQRVESKMLITNLTSTGDDNLLNTEEKDLEYRKAQLQRLKEEVIDLEDLREGVSITDLGLNDFRIDLSNYIRQYGKLKNIPTGLYAITQATKEFEPGVVFVLKNINNELNIDKQNRLHPYYLVYVKQDGLVVYNHMQAKKTLDALRLLCKGNQTPFEELCSQFNYETSDGRKMKPYSDLLDKSIRSILKTEEEKEVFSLFKSGGTTALGNKLKGKEDFKLISFVVIR